MRKMGDPTLSIVVPVYNGEKYLAQALESILRQPNRDLEIIVVDDGSIDSSGEIADRFAAEDNRIRVIHKTNGGVAAARNTGISVAQGLFVGFLDADDVLCKDVYSDELREELVSGNHDMVEFAYFLGTQNLSRGRLVSCADGLLIRETDDPVEVSWKCFCSNLYRRSILVECGFPEGIRVSEDVVFLFLIRHRACRIMRYSKPWFIYRRNLGSVMHTGRDAERFLAVTEAWCWCRNHCQNEADRNTCDGQIFNNMAEYIRHSCYAGVSVDRIQKTIHDSMGFQEAIRNFGNYWVSKELLEVYEGFAECPDKTRRSNQLKGLLPGMVKRIGRTRIGTKVYEAFRYRIPLAEYLL